MYALTSYRGIPFLKYTLPITYNTHTQVIKIYSCVYLMYDTIVYVITMYTFNTNILRNDNIYLLKKMLVKCLKAVISFTICCHHI